MNDKNEENKEENIHKADKIEGINWDQIWQIPDGLNGPNSYIYPFYINCDNIQNLNQIENLINESFDSNESSSYLLEELFSAIEDAIDADFQNEYLNSKIKDIYFKINPEE